MSKNRERDLKILYGFTTYIHPMICQRPFVITLKHEIQTATKVNKVHVLGRGKIILATISKWYSFYCTTPFG